MFLRPTEVFRIPKAFYMIFVCFPLFGRKKKSTGAQSFLLNKVCSSWKAFLLPCASADHYIMRPEGCARKEKRRRNQQKESSWLEFKKKKVLFFVKYHKFAGRLVSVIAFWAYATSEAPSPPLKKYTQNVYFDLQVLFK